MKRKQSGFKIMMRLIKLVKPLAFSWYLQLYSALRDFCVLFKSRLSAV